MFSSRTLALLVCVMVVMLVASCGGQSEPDSTAVAQAVAETLTAMPTVAATATVVIPPTATPAPTATDSPSPTSTVTPEPSATPTATEVPPTPTATSAPATAAPTETPAPQAAQNGNLRAGPGTNYAVTGSVRAGEQLDLTGQNEAGDWYALTRGNSEAWIAAFLVSNPPSGPLPVKESTAPTVTPTPPPQVVIAQPSAQPNQTESPNQNTSVFIAERPFSVRPEIAPRLRYLQNAGGVIEGDARVQSGRICTGYIVKIEVFSDKAVIHCQYGANNLVAKFDTTADRVVNVGKDSPLVASSGNPYGYNPVYDPNNPSTMRLDVGIWVQIFTTPQHPDRPYVVQVPDGF